jgi:hypothetical protein
METVPLAAAFITIVRAVSDLYKKFKKHEEAEAIEKAATAMQGHGDIPETKAKQIYAETLTKELGEEKARPVIDFTETLETFFPIRPIGAPLRYGIAISQIILQIHQILSKLQVFKLFGSKLEFVFSGEPFYAIGAGQPYAALLPARVYALKAFICEHPYVLESLKGPIVARDTLRMKDLFVLEDASTRGQVFVDINENSPFSLVFSNKEGKFVDKRLQAFEFRLCMNGLIKDAKEYVEKAAREFEESKEEARQFHSFIEAMKELEK